MMVSRSQPKSEHTQTPWLVSKRASFRVIAEWGDTIATVGCDSALRDQCEANAAFIVEAVNNYASLKARIQVLEEALQFIADGYENHNVNHVDYRVKAYQVATDALNPEECK